MGVGSVAALVESVVIARRMIVLAFDVNLVQLGSLSSFALVSSLCLIEKCRQFLPLRG